LLWDASEDSAQLLHEYYTHFFGEAADPIRHFYERAEAHRNAHEGKAEWIKFYKDEAGIELFSADVLRELRGLIELAKAAVLEDPRRRARVAVVSEAFAFTEAYAARQTARQRLVECALQVLSNECVSDAKQVDQLESMLSDFGEARVASQALLAELIKDSLHGRLGTFNRVGQSDPTALTYAAMAYAGRRLAHDNTETALAKVAERWADQDGAFRPMLSNVGLAHTQGAPAERNFLGPALPSVPGWHFDFRASEQLAVGAAEGSIGKGLRVSGADVFSIFRDIPVIAGEGYLLDAWVAYCVSADNRTKVKLTWTDRDGRDLGSVSPLRFPRGDSEGARHIVIPMRAPKEAFTLRVHFTVSRQAAGDFLELDKVSLGLIVD
jgi:hypothetical protein